MSGLDDLNFDDVEYDVNSPAWQDPAYRRQMQSSPSRPMAPSGIPMDIATDPDLGFGGQTVAQAMQRAPSVDALDFSDVEPERKPIGMMDFLRNPVGSVSLAVQQQLGRNDPSESIDRTWTEALVTDPATDLRRGTRNVVSGLLGAPVDALNLATAVTNPIEAARRVAGGAPLVEQPDVVRGMQAGIAEASEQDIAQNASAKRQAQLAELPAQGGAIDTFGYLATNPSAAGGELLAQVPQLLQFIRGSKWGTIALQSLSAGSQNADQVYQTLLSEGAPPEEAERLSSAVANVSTLANAGFTVLPGGGALERGLAGQAGREGARDAGSQVVRSLLGETGSEAGQEASDQAIQNVATGRPVGEGVGAAAALGATVGAPGGALAAVSDVLADRQAPVITPPPAATTAAPVENPLSAAIAEALGAQTAQNAPQGAPSPGAPSVPAQPSAPSPARSGPESGAVIDTRLQNLREAAAGRLESNRVRDLVRERDELEALVREQDALAADNVRGTPQTRLSPEERATADQRRADVRAELEAHRAGQSAQTQLDRLQARLDRIDNDADLARLADELAPVDAGVPAGVPSGRRQPAGDSGESDAQRQQVQPDEGGAQVREALLAEAPQERAGEARREPRQETAAPAREVAPLAPRVPPAAQVPDTLTLENARAEYDQARTDDERAAAAARIAAVRARDREGVRSVADQGEGSGPAVRPDESARSRGVREQARGGDASPQLRNATSEVTDTNDADIRAALGPAARGISVSASPRDLPDADRNRLGLTEADLDEVEGLYDPDTGRSYVFTGNLGTTMRSLGLSEAQAKVWVAAHERSGHAGLRGMLPDVGALTETLRRANSNPTISALADAIGGGRPERGAALVEEAIAELSAAFVTGDYRTLERKYGVSIPAAQRATVEGYIRRLFDAIRRALGRAGEGMSDTAIYQLVRDANRNAATAPVRGTSSSARAARSQFQNNASGESSASIEAINRLREERDLGRARLLIEQNGTVRPLFGVDAVDAVARNGQIIVQRNIGRDEWTVISSSGVSNSLAEGRINAARGKLDAAAAMSLVASRRRARLDDDLDGDSTTDPEESVPFSRRRVVNPYGEDAGTDLAGMPARVRVGDRVVEFHGYLPAQEIAAKYAARHGATPPTQYVQVDEQRARRIAAAYEAMEHAPDDPAVKRAYSAMIDETAQQYRDILKTGLQVEFIEGDDPYAASPRMAILDVVENNHLWVFPTDNGFGSSAFDVSENPLLAETDFEISGRKALANDIFRVVHDYFGHIANGVGFRADGEENAWREHSAMYSPLARRSMTSETRGKNSWLNYGPYGEQNRTASAQATVYADQKTGLLPEWVAEDGVGDDPIASRPRNPQVDTPEFKRWFGASKVVDENGDPLVVYHGSRRPDRIGDRFRADRATSGPMAYFTDDPAIASNYSQSKQDTSVETPESYAEWIRYKAKGSRTRTVDITKAWYDLTPEQRRTVSDKLPRVSNHTIDGDEMDGVRLGEPGEWGLSSEGHWQLLIREARGNVIEAAVEAWLNGGTLFGNEQEFMRVLELGGVPMDRVSYEAPNRSNPGVIPVYLRISNPFDTANLRDAMADLRLASRRRRGTQYGVDAWDKRGTSGAEWIARAEEDLERGTTLAWTTVPDWVTNTLRDRGHDGIKDSGGKYGGEGHAVWIPFSDRQVKSAYGNSGSFDPESPSIIASRPVFYSAALRAIEAGRGAPKKADSATWAGWLDGAVRRGEMKQGERDWLGIDDWIKDNAPVTREQLADFVRANQVQIEETTLGGADEGSFDPDEIDLQTTNETVGDDGSITYDIVDVETGDEFVVNVDDDAGNVYVQGPGGQFIEVHAPMNNQSMADAEFAIREWLIKKYEPKGDEGSDGPTRYSEYQVPGGENYRELLLRTPVTTQSLFQVTGAFARGGFESREDAQLYIDNLNASADEDGTDFMRVNMERYPPGIHEYDKPGSAYRSNHFDQENILAHARFNERTDADGNAVLFVEEIQSDWHQAGRRKGYDDGAPESFPALTSEEAARREELLSAPALSSQEAMELSGLNRKKQLHENPSASDEAMRRERRGVVPNAPLKASDEWAMLAFKRIARWAVDGGFAKIAWTTGEQQADRYDLAKQIDSIIYEPNKDGKTFIVSAVKNDRELWNHMNATPEVIEETLGKDIAQKIVSGDGADDSQVVGMKVLTGIDLKIGGEGMRAFYDNILPKAVNKWAKRFGARVSPPTPGEWYGYRASGNLAGPFKTAAEARKEGADKNVFEKAGGNEWHSIEVTDAMRDAVRDGQPVFSRRTPAQARAERQQLLGQLNTSGFPAGPAVPPPPGGKLAPVKDAADWLRVRLQDRMLEVRRAQERAGGENAPGITSVTLADSVNAYRLETLLHGAVRDTVEGGEHKYIRPIQGRLKNVKMSVPTFEGYLLARAAAEINAQVAIVNPAMPDGGSGITTADAAAVLAGTGPNPYTGKPMTATELQQAKSIATLVDGLRDETLQNMVDGHQLPAALAASLKKTYPNYIPTRGKEIPDWMQAFGAGTGRGLSGTKAPIKRRLGRGAGNLPRDILGEMAGDFQKSAVAKGKAKVNQAFLRFAMANPMPDLYEVEPVDLEWKFSKATGEAYLGVKASNDDGRTSMVIMLDGDPIRIRFKDEGIRDAVLNMGPEDMAGVIKTLGAVNRWRSKVLTQYNPAFAPVNMTRDAIFGLTALAAEHGVGVAAQAAAGYLPAMRAMYRQNTKRPGDTNKPISQFDWDDWAREASANGMKTGLTRVDDVKDLQRRMSAGATTLMQLAAEGRPWSLARESVIRAMGPIVETISNANDATENALRLSAYVALRKQGMSAERAAEYAKNMTINFNRKGQWGSALNAFYLFYNASIQGTHAVQRVLRNPKVLTGLIALSSLQGLLLRQMMDDDDNDGITPLDTVPDYVRRTSFVVPLGWATGDQRDYFAIPMPYGFNVFTYTGGRVSQWASLGARPTDESLFADVAKSLMESFSPVPINGDYGSLYGDQLGFAMQLMANRDDEGRPISNLNTNAPYDIPRALQGRTTTPAIYEWAAHSLAKLGGADLKERIPPVGYLDVSPEQVETVANYFGGGLIRLVNQGLSWKETFNADTFEGGMDAISRTPILSRFIGKGNEARAIADHYYGERGELARKIDVLQDELQGLSDAEVPRAIREAGARDVDLRGLRADRYKTKARKGQIKRTGGGKSGQGRVTLARGEGSTASVMKGADSAVADYGRQIERIRASDITVQQVVDIGLDNRMTLEDLGLPKEYNGSAVAPNRVKQRAIRFLQQARSERQSGALGVVGWNRENAMSPDDYMGKYWGGQ